MNRRKLFTVLPALPVAAAASVAQAGQEKTAVRLPQKNELDWGQTLNDAIRTLEEEVNRLKGFSS